MTPIIGLAAVIDDEDCNLTTQQKAVYDWHEERHSDEAIDIYSPEWLKRILEWQQWFTQTHGASFRSEELVQVQDLDIRVFFLAHPIAAFSLWHVLQAFYQSDRAVCGTTPAKVEKIGKWQELKPFDYFVNVGVKQVWKQSLKLLNKEIQKKVLVDQALTDRLHDILCAVKRFDDSLAALENSFQINLTASDSVDFMLKTIRDAVDMRCLMIADLLKPQEDAPRTDIQKTSNQTSSESTSETTPVTVGVNWEAVVKKKRSWLPSSFNGYFNIVITFLVLVIICFLAFTLVDGYFGVH